MITKRDIATRLRWMREHARSPDGSEQPITRAELARRLALSPTYITLIENGASPEGERDSRRPPLERIDAWARACGYSAELTFLPPDAPEHDVLAQRLRALPAEHRQLVSLLAEVSPSVPSILRRELQVRLEAWREHLSSWSGEE